MEELVINIDTMWLDAILVNQKTVEGRLRREKYLQLVPGSRILFRDATRNIGAIVKTIHHYKGEKALQNYLEQEGLRRTVPGATNISHGIYIYTNEPINWKQQDILKYGVIAIEFVLC